MTRRMLIALALLIAVGCVVRQSPVAPVGGGGAGGMGGGAGLGGAGGSFGVAGAVAPTACGRAQLNLERLRCPEAKTPHGAPFGVACEAARRDGRDWHPDCIAKVDTCAAVASAYRGCK
jgi:hypothetical protein